MAANRCGPATHQRGVVLAHADSTQTEADFPMRTKQRDDLANACALRAIRRLIHDSDWAPEVVVDLVKQRQGYPLSQLDLLAVYAPVRIWRRSDSAELETWQTGARVFDRTGCWQLLATDDLIAICFVNSQGRGHIETVGIQEIAPYFRYPVAALLTYNKEAAVQWQYCGICEMQMPPDHACSTVRLG